jgi:hypothetical protein
MMTELIPLELVRAVFPDIEWKPGYRLSKSLRAERVAIGSDGSESLLVPLVYKSSITYGFFRDGEADEDGYRYFKSHDDLLAYYSEFCHEAMKSLMKERSPS